MPAKRPPREKLPLPTAELMAFEEPETSPAAPAIPVVAPAAAPEAPQPPVVTLPPAVQPAAVVEPPKAISAEATCVHCGVATSKPVRVRRETKGVVTWETYAPGHRSDRG